MITHAIIKVKPKVVPQQGSIWPETREVLRSQSMLQDYLDQTPVVGAMVTSIHGDITSLYQINYVVCVQDDFEQYKVDPYGAPETHFLLQLKDNFNPHIQPWARWAPGKLYRCITKEEQAKWINDNVQDCLQKTIAQRKEQGKTP